MCKFLTNLFKKPEVVITPKQEAINWLMEDIAIHYTYLNKPENIATGTYAYHKMWIAQFLMVIGYINGAEIAATKEQAIGFIESAQATHAGLPTSIYSVAAWHYKWWQRYEKILGLLRSEVAIQ